MSGIAGIAAAGRRADVDKMLAAIGHRGSAGRTVFEVPGATLGAVWTTAQGDSAQPEAALVQDYAGEGHFAQAGLADGKLTLRRDPLGVAPLYYGRTDGGALCFASEVKALLGIAREVHEVEPGCSHDGAAAQPYYQLRKQAPLTDPPESVAGELRRRLEKAVARCIGKQEVGSWLSGGLDSSVITALARAHVQTLHSFAGGLAGAPDLAYAQEAARFIRSEHHEIVVTLRDMLAALPEVIYHLESFDALLVRSSLNNYLVAKAAADYVDQVFSGEGGDELFAGYDYLAGLPRAELADELIDITGRLHNTALQRVDRCASAHGLVAHVVFLDPQVVDYGLRIPPEYKLHEGVEKWILRRAMTGRLPEGVLARKKAKFWQGAGVGELLADHAAQQISDGDFSRQRHLPNGWTLNTKEELMYYRVFRERFPGLEELDWMGRTKGAPVAQAP